ncbi:putative xanthine dehydrogenase subunit A [Pandoraea cepalis]|uniref:Putative xanthine dehydrogenase subunit A n=1 Tax=Pandoraea cepalis TaxID=2508294 RepID=A0A5E4X252_9BURK|nr:hypothetical protein [Pandoraea cepalis]VVE30354.1 putative xanthine dehydrogenase subunit A [Pandoraea cepalis]
MLELVVERVTPRSGLDAIGHGRLGVRELDLRTGVARVRNVTQPAAFDYSTTRLTVPFGLPLGARPPPEIALAILAEITGLRNGVSNAVSVGHLQGSRECRTRIA